MPGPSLGTPVPAPGAAQAPKPAQAAPLPKSRADAQPATFVWFLWKIYDSAAPSERLGLLNQIKKLTQ